VKHLRAVLPVVLLAAVLVLAASCAPAESSRGTGTASELRTYSPSVDASGGADVTAGLNAFFASVPDGAVVDLRTNGRYRVEGTLLIARHRNLTVRGNGATLFATTTGDFGRAHVMLQENDGITIQNLKVVGANPGAGDRGPYLGTLDGQHGFLVLSSTEVALTGVSVSDTYGDFVYIGRRDGARFSDGVVVQRSTFTRSGRQGIAVTGARNVVIDGNTIVEAKRASIDLEPGWKSGAVVDHVTITGNQVYRGGLLFVAANGHGPVNHVLVQGNRMTGMTMGMDVNDLDGGRRSGWQVIGNTSDLPSGGGETMEFTRVDGIEVRDNLQPMKPMLGNVGVLAEWSCGVTVSGNTFPDAGAHLERVPAAPTC